MLRHSCVMRESATFFVLSLLISHPKKKIITKSAQTSNAHNLVRSHAHMYMKAKQLPCDIKQLQLNIFNENGCAVRKFAKQNSLWFFICVLLFVRMLCIKSSSVCGFHRGKRTVQQFIFHKQ